MAVTSDVTSRLTSDVTPEPLSQLLHRILTRLPVDTSRRKLQLQSTATHIRIRNLSELVSTPYLFSQPAVEAKAKALLQGASGCVYTHSKLCRIKILV